MVFSSLVFLCIFLPAVFLLYSAIPNLKVRNGLLIVASLVFYAYGEPVYVLLMLFSSVLNYLCARFVRAGRHGRSRTALVIAVAVNLGILAAFKYTGFFVSSLNSVFSLSIPVPQIALPVGISFFTFQALSYVIDVYRGDVAVQKNYFNVLLYISFFPQLIAGPIVKYHDIAQQIENRSQDIDKIARGLRRFICGLAKKVLIANTMGQTADVIFSADPGALALPTAWLGAIAYLFQIYYDFSGYSDMAIGLGLMFGFTFKENFMYPYGSVGIKDFWRRWHISLGSFFRDYLYIPLGGNRRHQAFNILLVWFLTGMWHGASWNFIIWGIYFGFIVTVEKYTILRIRQHIPSPLLHLYSLTLVIVGWGIFYFDDSSKMVHFFEICFGQGAVFHDYITISALADNCWLWVTCLLFCMPLRNRIETLLKEYTNNRGTIQESLLLMGRLTLSILLIVLSVALLVGDTIDAFIYTRF